MLLDYMQLGIIQKEKSMNKRAYFIKRKCIELIKNVIGIRSFGDLIQKYRTNLERWIYKKQYTVDDLINLMKLMGMKEGSNIFIHSSWGQFYNFKGTQQELIVGILDVIGPSGTLAMPAIPLLRKNKIFDVRKSVTNCGLLAETFRTYPGVKRSCNVQHSVCAIGPQSEFLLNEHHLSETCWDEKSPYFKLSQINALVFSFGLGQFIGTIIHCTESLLEKESPFFNTFFNKSLQLFEYIDYSGVIRQYYCRTNWNTPSEISLLKKKYIVWRYFNRSMYCNKRLSNLSVSVFDAKYTIETLLTLGRKGVTIFT